MHTTTETPASVTSALTVHVTDKGNGRWYGHITLEGNGHRIRKWITGSAYSLELEIGSAVVEAYQQIAPGDLPDVKPMTVADLPTTATHWLLPLS